MSKVLVEKKITALARCRPCMIITTLHENGVVNGGSFGAYTNLGPEEIGIAIGMASDTYRNLRRTGEFVINIPTIDHAAALEVCGRNPTDGASEVILAGLTTTPASEVAVPLITECVVNIECRYWKELEIGFHAFVIGKVVCGHIEKSARDVDGGLDPVKARVPFALRYPDPVYAVLDHRQTVHL